MSQRPSAGPRNLSAKWDRLRPVKQDPLESVGFPSKGDNRLLDPRTQDSYYNRIVNRYLQFCSHHSKNLEEAHKALYRQDNPSSVLAKKEDPTPQNVELPDIKALSISTPTGTHNQRSASPSLIPVPATELSNILTALRKLREGLRASSSTTSSPVFAQRVHVFNIRLAILALHHESYHQALLHLLFVLHTKDHPLPRSELIEMSTYFILDLATRQQSLSSAYAARYNSRIKFGYENRSVDTILRAIATNNWVAFWRVRRKVDGHIRAILFWHAERLRNQALKAIGRTYMTCDIQWILASTSGNELSWEALVEMEKIGWIREGDNAIIRKPKAKGTPANAT